MGVVRSPDFEAVGTLSFRVGGGHRDSVGVFLLDGETVLGSWRGHKAEALETVEVELATWAGKTLRVEVRDGDVGGWGHVLADRFVIVGE